MKAALLREGLPRLYRRVSSSLTLKFYENKKFIPTFHLTEEDAVHLDSAFRTYRPDDWDECRKINRADFQRIRRLKHRVSFVAEHGGIFLTLTFDEDTLANTTAATRRQYVYRYLKSLGAPCYVANVDYGGQNGREHYHAVIALERVSYADWHVHGAIKGERIRVCEKSRIKLSKYVSKLVNHAIKETTRRQHLIYSR